MRLISPPERTKEVLETLEDCTGVTNIAFLRGAARQPAGDLIFCDLAREAANTVIGRLEWLRDAGSIAVEQIDLSVSRVAEEAEEEAPGESDDAVVWEALAQRVEGDSRITWAYLAFFAIAVQIAGIGVLMDSPILIVGAMVLGPEFGAVAGICFGLIQRKWGLIGDSAWAIAVGFAGAIAVTFACAFVSRRLGWIDSRMLEINAEVQFIVYPDKWSFIVAILAGAAGVLSITAGKSSALVGVFISVTTIPAAGYAAVAMALSEWQAVGGAAAQLGVNLAGMVISGTATLLIQRTFWPQAGQPAGRTSKSSV
ncbi:DUF389 domain-containing protein [Thermoactinospora rubra]|uniref:DUF389 domain-containing protein n=1 Tax=Thermoactinospora rubra TaxID=1088767 RepID=UPI001F0AC9D0|nr:DUF389 domain-containing protein [Thermoactinospora rubra]